LGVVKRILELHSGTVEVRSEGAGTEFTVRLPLIADVSMQTIEPKPQALKRQRIAVIEDHDDGREALVIALQLLGHDVQAASSGEAGIELVQRIQPDFVLVDIGLPDVDGYEVARVLRARWGERMKLMALTGYGQQADRTRSSDAGFNAHLVKPVAPEDLLRLLSNVQ
jgi:CheY-like chemotaxis protein